MGPRSRVPTSATTLWAFAQCNGCPPPPAPILACSCLPLRRGSPTHRPVQPLQRRRALCGQARPEQAHHVLQCAEPCCRALPARVRQRSADWWCRGTGQAGVAGTTCLHTCKGGGELKMGGRTHKAARRGPRGGGTGVGGAGRRVRVGVWAGSVGAAGSALQSAPMTLAAADEASCPSSQPCPPPLLPGRATTALAPGRRHRAGACLHPPTRRCTTAPPPPQGGPDAAGRFAPLHLHRVSPGLGSGGRSQ